MQTFGFVKTTFQGVLIDQNDPNNNLPKAISVPGLKAGDLVIDISMAGNDSNFASFFSRISTDDEITQKVSQDFSSTTFTIVVLRLG